MLNSLSTHLKYPPIKYNLKKIPDKLIFYAHYTKLYHDFNMCTTKEPLKSCRMYCNVSTFDVNGKQIPSVLVYLIASEPRKQGLGFDMLKLVSRFSKENGCSGRFHLYADTTLLPNEVPHVFYRKFGMSTGDAKTDAKIDKFIKNGKKMTYKDINSMIMHYPPLPYQKEEKVSLWEKIKKVFGVAKKYI